LFYALFDDFLILVRLIGHNQFDCFCIVCPCALFKRSGVVAECCLPTFYWGMKALAQWVISQNCQVSECSARAIYIRKKGNCPIYNSPPPPKQMPPSPAPCSERSAPFYLHPSSRQNNWATFSFIIVLPF